MVKIFETHAHYDDDAFDGDRETLIDSFKENGIYAVTNIGADLKSSQNTLELINKYDFFYGAVGVHPSDVDCLEEIGDDEKAIKLLLDMAESSDRVVAIGEIGLDYHYEDTDKPLQEKWFRKQLGLARLLFRHDQQIEIRLLPVGEEQILADLAAQQLLHQLTVRNGVGVLVVYAEIFDPQFVQQLIAALLLGYACIRRSAGI